MPAARKLAIGVLSARIAYGVSLVALPARLTRSWLGPAGQAGPTQVGVRGLGAREVVLHAGALAAASRDAPLRPWLAASVVGDVTDIASTVAARNELPERSPLATLIVAGGSALLSIAVAAALDA